MQQIKTVGIYHFPDNSFASTCRDVSRCSGWDEDATHVWGTQHPHFKLSVLFKGAADQAEKVRICIDAALKAQGCSQRNLVESLEKFEKELMA